MKIQDMPDDELSHLAATEHEGAVAEIARRRAMASAGTSTTPNLFGKTNVERVKRLNDDWWERGGGGYRHRSLRL